MMMSSLAAHLECKIKLVTRKLCYLHRVCFFKPENLGHAGEVHSHAESPVASELVEAVGTQVHGHQGHVGVVHRLDVNDHRIALSTYSELIPMSIFIELIPMNMLIEPV